MQEMINATLIRATLEAAIEKCSITSDNAAFANELYANVGKYRSPLRSLLLYIEQMLDGFGARCSVICYRITTTGKGCPRRSWQTS